MVFEYKCNFAPYLNSLNNELRIKNICVYGF